MDQSLITNIAHIGRLAPFLTRNPSWQERPTGTAGSFYAPSAALPGLVQYAINFSVCSAESRRISLSACNDAWLQISEETLNRRWVDHLRPPQYIWTQSALRGSKPQLILLSQRKINAVSGFKWKQILKNLA
ncbi:hypothetical protein [Beijerinckia indica]|uniref:hypothetical protein n=1 Tax=Beijerinckia indica TaxID=533 RepID=UPI0011D163E8|nr:hypothetical protein [Beijerinckia indica]